MARQAESLLSASCMRKHASTFGSLYILEYLSTDPLNPPPHPSSEMPRMPLQVLASLGGASFSIVTWRSATARIPKEKHHPQAFWVSGRWSERAQHLACDFHRRFFDVVALGCRPKAGGCHIFPASRVRPQPHSGACVRDWQSLRPMPAAKVQDLPEGLPMANQSLVVSQEGTLKWVYFWSPFEL